MNEWHIRLIRAVPKLGPLVVPFPPPPFGDEGPPPPLPLPPSPFFPPFPLPPFPPFAWAWPGVASTEGVSTRRELG
eukprot:9356994-Lingulodinium_polyedra.AAC.1